jgi:hypothetical protein
MWATVLITPLISSNFSCWSLHCLSCDLPFWLPIWYLENFLVGQEIQWPTRKVWRYQRGNQNGKSHDRKYNDQQEKFEDIKGVIRTVNHMTGNTFLVGHCIACHVIYRSDYPFDIFKLFVLVIVFPVMWYTVLITPQNGKSHDRQYNDQHEKFEDIKGVIRTVTHMTGNTMTNKKGLKISKG